MVSTSTHSIVQGKLAARKLVWLVPLTIVVVALANLVVRTLAGSFLDVPVGFLMHAVSALLTVALLTTLAVEH